MVVCIGTCGVHVRLTAVQAIWRKRIVLSARKQTLIGAVVRQPVQYSSGTLTVEYLACTGLTTAQDLPFLDTPLSILLGLDGGMFKYNNSAQYI
jgi:hypothetical protein